MTLSRLDLNAVVVASLAFALPAIAQTEVKTLSIGAEAPPFRLPGVDDKTYTLEDFADAEVLALIFTCNHCPTAQAYEDRFQKFQDNYKDKGVAVVAVSPNDPQAVRLDELGYTDVGDSLEDMKIRAEEQGFQFPYLYDGETQEMSRAYGVLATPHVYIFDKDRKLRYNGRFDDSDVKEVQSHDAINAVDALLAGKPVPVETTRVFGCSTKWSDKREEAKLSLEKWDAEPVDLEPIGLSGLRELAGNSKEDDGYLLVNLWATWCGPCVAELPEFVEMNRMYRKRPFRLVTISLDDLERKDEALKVLKENKVSSTNYIVDSENHDAIAEAIDADWPGPIPYTLLIAPGGEVVYRKLGSIDPLELRRAIIERTGRTYANR